MSSENRFSPPGKIQSGDIYEVFTTLGEPVLTTSEINNEIDWASRSTVLRKLKEMAESDDLRSKKAGDKSNAGVVWYLPDEIEDIPQPTPDLIRIVYRHPWFSLVVGGLFFTGFGFALFVPGFFGEGLYLGLVSRNSMVLISIGLYAFGIAMASAGSVLIIVEAVVNLLQNRVDWSDLN